MDSVDQRASESVIGRDLVIARDAPVTAMLRIKGTTDQSLAALGGGFGVQWSTAPNTSTERGDLSIAWLAPGEWALIGVGCEPARRIVEQACPDALFHVADMSDAWRRWRVSGLLATEILAKGCSLDFHERVFPVGRCARTLLGQVGILLIRERASWAFHAEAALERHIDIWLTRAGREYDLEKAAT